MASFELPPVIARWFGEKYGPPTEPQARAATGCAVDVRAVSDPRRKVESRIRGRCQETASGPGGTLTETDSVMETLCACAGLPERAAWHELGRMYRRLEARGEIRGGYFVGGVGGEQFALPEAVGRLRSIRNSPVKGELLAISGADPLNLAGILTPGRRVASIAGNRILLRDGVPVAALEGREILPLVPEAKDTDDVVERSLRIGSMPATLRPYYT